MLSELVKNGIEVRDQKQLDKNVQYAAKMQKVALERSYTSMRTTWSNKLMSNKNR